MNAPGPPWWPERTRSVVEAPDEGQDLVLVGAAAIVGAGALMVLLRTRALARLVGQELE